MLFTLKEEVTIMTDRFLLMVNYYITVVQVNGYSKRGATEAARVTLLSQVRPSASPATKKQGYSRGGLLISLGPLT